MNGIKEVNTVSFGKVIVLKETRDCALLLTYKEYVVAIYPSYRDGELTWGYGHYHDDDLDAALRDYNHQKERMAV